MDSVLIWLSFMNDRISKNTAPMAASNMMVAAKVPMAAPFIPMRLNSSATAVPVNPWGSPSPM